MPPLHVAILFVTSSGKRLDSLNSEKQMDGSQSPAD